MPTVEEPEEDPVDRLCPRPRAPSTPNVKAVRLFYARCVLRLFPGYLFRSNAFYSNVMKETNCLPARKHCSESESGHLATPRK